MASHNVALTPIDEQNRAEIISLGVLPEQGKLIATNERSLKESAENPACIPMAICSDDGVVGFLMYELRGHSVALLHRFMVDWRHQRRGLGRQAMQLLVDELFRQGVQTMFLSFRPENLAARCLYDQFGFVQHEVEPDGEVVYRLGPAREIPKGT